MDSGFYIGAVRTAGSLLEMITQLQEPQLPS